MLIVFVCLAAIAAISSIVRGLSNRNALGRRRDEFVASLHRAMLLRTPRFSAITDRACDLIDAVCTDLKLDNQLAIRAATLRDIGLSSVSYSLLNHKEFADWTEDDFESLRSHMATTDELLSKSPSFQAERVVLQESEAIYWVQSPSEQPRAESLVLKLCCDLAFNEAFHGVERAETILMNGIGRQYEQTSAQALLKVLHSNRVRVAQPIAQ